MTTEEYIKSILGSDWTCYSLSADRTQFTFNSDERPDVSVTVRHRADGLHCNVRAITDFHFVTIDSGWLSFPHPSLNDYIDGMQWMHEQTAGAHTFLALKKRKDAILNGN